MKFRPSSSTEICLPSGSINVLLARIPRLSNKAVPSFRARIRDAVVFALENQAVLESYFLHATIVDFLISRSCVTPEADALTDSADEFSPECGLVALFTASVYRSAVEAERFLRRPAPFCRPSRLRPRIVICRMIARVVSYYVHVACADVSLNCGADGLGAFQFGKLDAAPIMVENLHDGSKENKVMWYIMNRRS